MFLSCEKDLFKTDGRGKILLSLGPKCGWERWINARLPRPSHPVAEGCWNPNMVQRIWKNRHKSAMAISPSCWGICKRHLCPILVHSYPNSSPRWHHGGHPVWWPLESPYSSPYTPQCSPSLPTSTWHGEGGIHTDKDVWRCGFAPSSGSCCIDLSSLQFPQGIAAIISFQKISLPTNMITLFLELQLHFLFVAWVVRVALSCILTVVAK